MRGNRVDADAPRNKSIFAIPAVRALLLQLLAFFIIAFVVAGLSVFADMAVPLLVAAALQGGVAAWMSRRPLARWWVYIQFFFPVALVVLNSWQLPPGIFLSGFLVFLVLYWSTFRTQVPFYPSNPAVWNAVVALLPADRPVRFIDIGSGFGGLVLHLAGRCSGEFTGIELAPLPWLASRLRSRLRNSGGRFIRGDYDELDFAQFDVVFAYLSPAAMPALWRKAQAEMRPGTLLLSYEFPIPGTEPQIVVSCGRRGECLHGWRM